MAEPTLQELNDSIAELEAYRNRLREDVIAMEKAEAAAEANRRHCC